MSNMDELQHEPWPALTAATFEPTSHLLYMGLQVIGKLMLTKPFEPHWANLAMPLTSRGMTTGVIPYRTDTFSVDVDFIDHVVTINVSTGKRGQIKLQSMSVAELTERILHTLSQAGVDLIIDLNPQEMSNSIPFNDDIARRVYDEKVVNAWWRIMLSTYRVLLQYHAKFYGISPVVGLCWGTLDLRDARYKGLHLPVNKAASSYIGRNGMDDVQVEVGFSCNNENYPFPAFFGFAYPLPDELPNAGMKPDGVKWVAKASEFMLDYETLRQSKQPDVDLLVFFETFYQTVAKLAKWDPSLMVSGKPV
jgi:hypothetical protein